MGQKNHILLINKEQHFRDAGIRMLSAAGCPVHAASTLREALAGIASEPIGLIVCGLELEDISAIGFLKYLKNDPLREAIPFLFCIHSKSRTLLPLEHAHELGAEAVICYPMEADSFIDQMRRHLPDFVSEQKSKFTAPATFPESFLQQRKETGAEKKKRAAALKNARVSVNGRDWAPCQIINYTYHGTMVETKLRGKQWCSVLLRYRMPAGPVIVKGRLIHILLGDHERPMGMGINFKGDAAWRQVYSHIKSNDNHVPRATKPSPATPPPPAPAAVQPSPIKDVKVASSGERIRPADPIGIEVSRDGSLWMYGEIVEYEKSVVSITTPVLAKSGEKLHVRFTMEIEQIVIEGEIESVTLNDFKMPAGMEIRFPEEGKWNDIRGDLAKNKEVLKQSENIRTPMAPRQPASSKDADRKASKKQEWADTLVESEKFPGTESIKHRFYKSLIGKKLGNYEIASFLDAGSMGGVFKGWDIALERDVAVKVISYELSSQEEFVEMFFKEARLVSRLNHPNIAHIYFIGNEAGIVYYSMEFIHGKTLSELMDDSHCIEVNKAAAYLADSCRALDRVWQEKIIHRDIKPANIMISEHGLVKLLDFGVAQKQKKGGTSSKDKIVGSPPYLSPETIREKPVDLRSDIYSLGATFYHVLTGSPPFMDTTLEGILRKHLDENPIPLEKVQPDIPLPVSDTIQKMLAKDPNNRFQSYQEIIDALAAL